MIEETGTIPKRILDNPVRIAPFSGCSNTLRGMGYTVFIKDGFVNAKIEGHNIKIKCGKVWEYLEDNNMVIVPWATKRC